MADNKIDHSESASSAYRAYLIGQDGKVERSVPIHADNDQSAIEQATALARSYEVELWDRSRVLVRLTTNTAR